MKQRTKPRAYSDQNSVNGSNNNNNNKVIDEVKATVFKNTWKLILFRIINALIVDTYFNPDEFWQGPEVAHNMVFGYGHLSWEWKNNAKLRGATHPLLLFGVPYKILQMLGIDSPFLVAFIPRIIQGIIAGIGDAYIYLYALKIFNNPDIAYLALFCSIFSWFHFYCLIRTFSNSIETVLTIVSLYYWPPISSTSEKNGGGGRIMKSMDGIAGDDGNSSNNNTYRVWGIFWCGACVTMRPTSAVLWTYVGICELYRLSTWKTRFRMVFYELIPAIMFWLLTSLLIDRWFYGEWTVILLNFFDFNFVKGLDKLYGTHPFHWYFTEGFTANVAFFLPIYFYSIYHVYVLQSTKKNKKNSLKIIDMKYLYSLTLFTMLVFSIGGHKEFRFILPLLPITLVQCGYGLFHLEKQISKTMYKNILGLLIISNFILGMYVSIYHQSSPLKIMKFLRNEEYANTDVATTNNSGKRVLKSVHFLMPCHSTPYYSHLHRNIPMWFIDCSPPYMVKPQNERQQIKYFEKNPLKFVNDIYYNNKNTLLGTKQYSMDDQDQFIIVKWYHKELPSHIVTFDSYENRLLPFFKNNGYEKIKEFFHSHVKGDVDSNEHFQYASIWYRNENQEGP